MSCACITWINWVSHGGGTVVAVGSSGSWRGGHAVNVVVAVHRGENGAGPAEPVEHSVDRRGEAGGSKAHEPAACAPTGAG